MIMLEEQINYNIEKLKKSEIKKFKYLKFKKKHIKSTKNELINVHRISNIHL